MPSRKTRIALVDDEENIRETVAFALEAEGYKVLKFQDGRTAWESFSADLPDVAILDIILPGMDGLELCRRLRNVSTGLPILFLTSRDEEFDRVLGLELGADDYLCKPFSMRELVARVRVLLRRMELIQNPEESGKTKTLTFGNLLLDLDRYLAYWQNEKLPLTVTEFRILHALVRHPGHVKTREQLISEGYLHDTYVSERTIDSHVKRLRKKLNQAGADPSLIETVHGIGYRSSES